jgi:hypothetical protein
MKLPSTPTVISTAALVLAATGGASGATHAIGKLIAGNAVKPNSITSKDIARHAVHSSDIANGAIRQNQIAPGAIHAKALAPGSVDTDALADFAVTTDKLDLGAVTSDRLADGSATTSKLADGAVDEQKLALGSVGKGQLQSGSVSADKLATPLEPIQYAGSAALPFIGNAQNSNVRDSGLGPVGYYVDELGLVHLVGVADPSTDNQNPNQVFALPASLAPSHSLRFPAVCPCGAFSAPGAGEVIVHPGGVVVTFNQETSLDGVIFRPGE